MGRAHFYLHDHELSRSPPDESFIGLLKQNCCLSGPHFPPSNCGSLTGLCHQLSQGTAVASHCGGLVAAMEVQYCPGQRNRPLGMQHFYALALFGLNDDELLPDLHITGAGVLRAQQKKQLTHGPEGQRIFCKEKGSLARGHRSGTNSRCWSLRYSDGRPPE